MADAVRERMRQLKMSTSQLARESGLSETTVRYLGRSPGGNNKSTLVALSAVLRWPHDHLPRVLRGEPVSDASPAPASRPPQGGPSLARIETKLDSLAARVEWLLKREEQSSR